MLIPSTTVLKEQIVRVMAATAGMTANEIQAQMAQEYQRYTIQGVYKELRNLQADTVVVKSGAKYSLNLTWIINLISLTDLMFDSHIGHLSDTQFIPPGKSKCTWNITTIPRANGFWTQLMFSLLETSTSKKFYQWIPHPWFHLLSHHAMVGFQEAVRIGGYKIYSSVGGTTYLDRLFAEQTFLESQFYEISYAEGPFEGLYDTYYSLLDDYLITIKLDSDLASRLHNLFQAVEGPRTFDVSRTTQVLNQPGRISVSLERGTAKSGRIKKLLLDFFA